LISAIKGRILKIEDRVQENKETSVKIDDNRKCDITQTNNGDQGTQERPGAGLAFPTYTGFLAPGLQFLICDP
jgi:hypothetical protein